MIWQLSTKIKSPLIFRLRIASRTRKCPSTAKAADFEYSADYERERERGWPRWFDQRTRRNESSAWKRLSTEV